MVTPDNHPSRLYGLDSLRSLAILMVLLYHYKIVVSHEDTFGFITQVGWMGVDLFFVLSGFLIGDQILAGLKTASFSFRFFMARRLLRTLPNYYFVLALYFVFPVVLSGSSTASLGSFLTFSQNFALRPGQTFTHSWSLCVEEQFYVLLPLVLIALQKVKKFVPLFWVLLSLTLVACMSLRGLMWWWHGQAAITSGDYWQFIYYPTVTRFDELLPGVAIAMLKHYHPSRFQGLLKKGHWLFVASLVCMATLFYLFSHYFYIEGYGFSFLMTAFGYTALAISLGCLTLSALSPTCWLYRLRIPGATTVAVWSYAIYLIHKPVFQVLQAPMIEWGLNLKGLGSAGVMLGVSFFCGWLLYRWVETPFMGLRQRYFGANTAYVEVARLK